MMSGDLSFTIHTTTPFSMSSCGGCALCYWKWNEIMMILRVVAFSEVGMECVDVDGMREERDGPALMYAVQTIAGSCFQLRDHS